MADPTDEQDIARQLLGHSSPDAIPDHPPVPLVPDKAPTYHIQVLVPNRPGYIKGSGPPLTELLTQPPHTKTGFVITDYVEEERGKFCYIVSEQDNDESRVAVAPEDILEWVSQRTLEAYSCIEYARYEEQEMQKTRKGERGREIEQWDDENNTIAPKRGRKGKRGRAKRTREESMDVDEDVIYKEVIPAKKDRTLDRRRDPSESEADAAPSLSQPSLSQPGPSLKRKISALFARDSTPEETTDEIGDELAQAADLRHTKKLSIRDGDPNSPKCFRRATVAEERSPRSVLSVQIPAPSPLQKQSSAPAPPQQMQPPKSRGSATRIIPGAPKPLFPIFGSRNRPVASSEPPRSTSRIMPPERKRPALPASSRSFDK